MDLGSFDKPCLIFGGPYSNLQATEAVLDAAASHQIPNERIICTGDVVAYCGDPQATVELIRDSGIHALMGNCEESVGSDAADCGCGFDAGSTCDLLSIKWFEYATSRLSGDAKRWMRELPRIFELQMAGRRLAVIHGAGSEINRFIFPSTSTDTKLEELDLLTVDGVIAGHCGVPFTQKFDSRLWHNPGVVGMPANDGTTRVWYSVLTPQSDSIKIEHFPLTYDYQGAVQSMLHNALSEEYATALESGIWPADDIMPQADRNLRGRPISLAPTTWI